MRAPARTLSRQLPRPRVATAPDAAVNTHCNLVNAPEKPVPYQPLTRPGTRAHPVPA